MTARFNHQFGLPASPRHYPGWLTGFISALIVCCTMATAAYAQDSASKPDSSTTESAKPESTKPADESGTKERETPTSLEPTKNDVIYFPGPNGKPIAMPATADLKEYFEWLRANKNTSERPDYFVRNVSLVGAANAREDRVTFQGKLQIEVYKDDKDLAVPIGMQEGTLLRFRASRPNGVNLQRVDGKGYVCWVRGKGTLELEVTLSVGVRKQNTRRRTSNDKRFT